MGGERAALFPLCSQVGGALALTDRPRAGKGRLGQQFDLVRRGEGEADSRPVPPPMSSRGEAIRPARRVNALALVQPRSGEGGGARRGNPFCLQMAAPPGEGVGGAGFTDGHRSYPPFASGGWQQGQ